jgi:hypothetical protein
MGFHNRLEGFENLAHGFEEFGLVAIAAFGLFVDALHIVIREQCFSFVSFAVSFDFDFYGAGAAPR